MVTKDSLPDSRIEEERPPIIQIAAMADELEEQKCEVWNPQKPGEAIGGKVVRHGFEKGQFGSIDYILLEVRNPVGSIQRVKINVTEELKRSLEDEAGLFLKHAPGLNTGFLGIKFIGMRYGSPDFATCLLDDPDDLPF